MVKREIDQDGSGLDHGQEQPKSLQVMVDLLMTFYTWRKRRLRRRLTRMEVGHHGQEQPMRKRVKVALLVTFYTWRKRRSRKRLTRMEVGWIMVSSSQRVNRRVLNYC